MESDKKTNRMNLLKKAALAKFQPCCRLTRNVSTAVEAEKLADSIVEMATVRISSLSFYKP